MWQDEGALQAFVGTSAHLEVMQTLAGDMGETRFVRWTIRGSEVPPRWDDALGRAEAGPHETAHCARRAP